MTLGQSLSHHRIIAIAPSCYQYHSIATSHYRIITLSLHRVVTVSSYCRAITSLSSRYRTETYSLSRHHLIPHHITHYCTIMLSTQSQWCDNVIVNFMVLSRLHRNNIILSISGGILLTFIHIKQYNSQQILYNHVEFY